MFKYRSTLVNNTQANCHINFTIMIYALTSETSPNIAWRSRFNGLDFDWKVDFTFRENFWNLAVHGEYVTVDDYSNLSSVSHTICDTINVTNIRFAKKKKKNVAEKWKILHVRMVVCEKHSLDITSDDPPNNNPSLYQRIAYIAQTSIIIVLSYVDEKDEIAQKLMNIWQKIMDVWLLVVRNWFQISARS